MERSFRFIFFFFYFFQVISHGKIVYSATIKKLLGIITTISFKITAMMSPSARLIAYYVSKEKGNVVVSDSILLEVEDQFPNPVIQSYDIIKNQVVSSIFKCQHFE
jgi:hypothetical protein